MRDISAFKREMKSRFPDSTLSKVLDAEPNQLEDQEFLLKMPTWLKLAGGEKQ